MKKILYIGIFKATNIGDLAISNQIFEYLNSISDNYSIDLMDFSSLRNINYPSTEIRTSNISSYVKLWLSNSKLFLYVYEKYYESSFINKPFKEYGHIIDNYDILCIGGGNLLMSISDNLWAIKINKLVRIAKMMNKKVFVISVGAGPILSNKSTKLFEKSLNLADYITVRDSYSKDFLEKILKINKNVEISGDPVLLLSNKCHVSNKKNKKTINIAMSIMPFGKKFFSNLSWYNSYDYYLEMYKNIMEYFYDKNNNYIFYLFSTERSDYDTILELQEYVFKNSNVLSKKNIKVQYISKLSELLNFYQTTDLLIGTRMHSLIIAYTQSIPIIAISWQNKVEGFMEYIKCVEYCYSLNKINENIDEIYGDAQQLLISNIQNDEKNLLYLQDRFHEINNHFFQTLEY